LLILVFQGIPVSKSPKEMWKEREEKACLEHQIEGGLSNALLQISDEFISNARRGTLSYFVPMLDDGLIG